MKHTQVFKLKSCPSLTSSQSVRQANQNISYVYFTNAIINNDVTRSVRVLRKSRAMNKTFTCVSKGHSLRDDVFTILCILYEYTLILFLLYLQHIGYSHICQCVFHVFSLLYQRLK